MTTALQAALTAIDSAVEALVAVRTQLTGLTQQPAIIYDTYLTDVLDADGLWRPAWLDALNREYATPDGFIGTPEPDHDGNPATTSRRKVVLIGGFYFDLTLSRGDLTRQQQDEIHRWTQWAFGGEAFNIYNDEVTGLPRLPLRFTQSAADSPPGAKLPLAVPAQFYRSGQELHHATLRAYQMHLSR